MSRRAIHTMNTLYPDATLEEIRSGDTTCIICREEMISACKKLPCNHIFHTHCLRSWFQRQQTCPTCRLDILRPVRRPVNQPVPGMGPNFQQVPQVGVLPQPGHFPQGMNESCMTNRILLNLVRHRKFWIYCQLSTLCSCVSITLRTRVLDDYVVQQLESSVLLHLCSDSFVEASNYVIQNSTVISYLIHTYSTWAAAYRKPKHTDNWNS